MQESVKRHCMILCGKEPVMEVPEPEDLPFCVIIKAAEHSFL